MRVRPGPGLKIRHPETKQLHSHDDNEGFDVDEKNLFWAKLLELKDIVPDNDEKDGE